MKPHELRTWCAKRRGRLSKLASDLGISRQFVWQWTQGTRPIPADTLPIVVHEMKRAEAAERQAA